MSITIKLDAPALKALIADDAAFKLELHRAVTAEVIRTVVPKDIGVKEVQGYITAAVQDLLFDIRQGNHTNNYRPIFTPKPEVKADLEAMVAGLAKAAVSAEGLGTEDIVRRLVADMTPKVEGWVANRIDQRTSELVDTMVSERLAAIKASL